MKQSISESYFVDEIVKDEYNSISVQGARALFDYLEEYERDSGQDIEFDLVAIRCDFSEYENLDAVLDDYDNIKTLEDLQDNTTVIEIEGSDRLIIQAF
mgnify:FL=1|tara:strand:+ start:42 stop:338 length:297 start_codon:yes stop_codon:yes gene_type:complete